MDRIAQEAVSNAVQHAHPTQITIRLGATDTGVMLRVGDNGSGIG